MSPALTDFVCPQYFDIVQLFLMDKKSLLLTNPDLVKEWHPTKNGLLTPKDVTHGSGKKAWWLCEKGHEWYATINRRDSGTGCPYCYKEVLIENCLQTFNPRLAKEWHPTKNGLLTPRDITHGSGKKAWWLCEKGHEWYATINRRDSGTGCPYCNKEKPKKTRIVSYARCLQAVNPKLAQEWHPTKNGAITPNDVTANTGKKAWWICKRQHEWQAIISNRNAGSRCPYCHSKTSVMELRMFTELKYLFKDTRHRAKIKRLECDIYIPSLLFAIELDSFYYHRSRQDKDEKKNKILEKNGIFLLRLRGDGLNKISPDDISYSENDNHSELIKKVLSVASSKITLSEADKEKINTYLKRNDWANGDEFDRLLYMLPGPLPGNSLQDINPAISKEWHPTKNGSLTPKDVAAMSRKEVWWLCAKGHEWPARTYTRNRGHGCPYCSGLLATKENCLQLTNPALAQEWHPTKNVLLTPNKVKPSSNEKAWWLCRKGHEWQASITNRNHGQKCPFCSCLQNANPKLAQEWHPTKNGSLTTKDVVPGSNKKVWWLCKNGHEWLTSVVYRNSGSKCPYCAGRKK